MDNYIEISLELSQTFDTLKDVEEKLQAVAKKAGFTVSKGDSSLKPKRGQPYVVFICSRGKAYKDNHIHGIAPKTNIKRSRKSIRINCPFKIRVRSVEGDAWKIVQLVNRHNHQIVDQIGSKDTSGAKVTPLNEKSLNEGGLEKYQEVLNECMPSFMIDYVSAVVDVKGDGHCGFRSVAASLGRNEDDWLNIRLDLLHELHDRKSHYLDYVCGRDQEEYNKLCRSISFLKTGKSCSHDHFMIMPDTGFVIANAYQCPVYVFSKNMLCTFLPDNSACIGNDPISLILTNGDTLFGHYMSINLKPFSPAPPKIFNLDCSSMRSIESLCWDEVINPLIEKFEYAYESTVRSKNNPKK